MKTIEVDDELYSYIASHTKHIGESASDIFTAYVEIFRRITACCSGDERGSRCVTCYRRSEAGQND
ncbi:negative modulator of initiation of replication [Escherichia coli]|nr:negative modulator of initiation of replication [Escherichia coli]